MTCKPRSEFLGPLSSGEQGCGHPQGWLMGQNLLDVQTQRHPSGLPHLTSLTWTVSMLQKSWVIYCKEIIQRWWQGKGQFLNTASQERLPFWETCWPGALPNFCLSLLQNLFFENSGPIPKALGSVTRGGVGSGGGRMVLVKPMGSAIRLSQSDEAWTFPCLSFPICQMDFTTIGLISSINWEGETREGHGRLTKETLQNGCS